MRQILCILCGDNRIEVKEDIEPGIISDIYKERLNLDCSSYFQGKNIQYYQCNNCGHHFFNPEYAGDARFYELLQDARNSYYNLNRPEFKEALKFITNDLSVLEIGAGDGAFAKKLNLEKYKGLEFNKLAIDKAKVDGIILESADIYEYAHIHKEEYDVVVSHHVHEHVPDLMRFIKCGLITLKKGGYYIMSVPNNESNDTACINHTLNMPPHHISRFTTKSLKFLEHFGLKLISVKNTGFSKTRDYRINIFRLLIEKRLSSLLFGASIALPISRYKKIKKISSKIPKLLCLFGFEIFIKKVGPNNVVVFVKE